VTDLRRSRLLHAAVAVTSLAAAAALAMHGHDGFSRAFWFWAGLCILGESMWVRLPMGDATLTMAITFDFAAMLLLPTGQALAAIALSTLVGEALFMRKAPLRLLFNASQSVLAALAGITLWHALGGGAARMIGIQSLPACAAAAAAYTAVNTLAVSIMVAIEHRLPLGRVWRTNFGNAYELLSNGALFSLGAVLAIMVAQAGIEMVTLFAMPLLLAWISYRHFLSREGRAAAEEAEQDAA
jgi:hypothetical protein